MIAETLIKVKKRNTKEKLTNSIVKARKDKANT